MSQCEPDGSREFYGIKGSELSAIPGQPSGQGPQSLIFGNEKRLSLFGARGTTLALP
jgi:hypothetical protein